MLHESFVASEIIAYKPNASMLEAPSTGSTQTCFSSQSDNHVGQYEYPALFKILWKVYRCLVWANQNNQKIAWKWTIMNLLLIPNYPIPGIRNICNCSTGTRNLWGFHCAYSRSLALEIPILVLSFVAIVQKWFQFHNRICKTQRLFESPSITAKFCFPKTLQ